MKALHVTSFALVALASVAPSIAFAQNPSSAKTEDVEAAPTTTTSGGPKLGDELPWYVPTRNEEFRIPPPPPPPPPKTIWTLSANLTPHVFVGGSVKGSGTELTAHIGSSVVGFYGGVFAPGGKLVAGFDLARYQGVVVNGKGTPRQLSVLLPYFDLAYVGNAKDTHFMRLGTSLTGVRYCMCGSGVGVPLRFDLRLPTLFSWLPFEAQGESKTEQLSKPTSIGVTLEVGMFL